MKLLTNLSLMCIPRVECVEGQIVRRILTRYQIRYSPPRATANLMNPSENRDVETISVRKLGQLCISRALVRYSIMSIASKTPWPDHCTSSPCRAGRLRGSKRTCARTGELTLICRISKHLELKCWIADILGLFSRNWVATSNLGAICWSPVHPRVRSFRLSRNKSFLKKTTSKSSSIPA
jgi:hypothetical protein